MPWIHASVINVDVCCISGVWSWLASRLTSVSSRAHKHEFGRQLQKRFQHTVNNLMDKNCKRAVVFGPDQINTFPGFIGIYLMGIFFSH